MGRNRNRRFRLELKELGIDKAVRFLGRIEHDRLAAYYRQAHIFVLPSKNEGMSNSVLEALASGLSLVVSGTGGMQELVTDGENGRFIDPEDTTTFARVLSDLAASPEQIQTFSIESRRRAEVSRMAASSRSLPRCIFNRSSGLPEEKPNRNKKAGSARFVKNGPLSFTSMLPRWVALFFVEMESGQNGLA